MWKQKDMGRMKNYHRTQTYFFSPDRQLLVKLCPMLYLLSLSHKCNKLKRNDLLLVLSALKTSLNNPKKRFLGPLKVLILGVVRTV